MHHLVRNEPLGARHTTEWTASDGNLFTMRLNVVDAYPMLQIHRLAWMVVHTPENDGDVVPKCTLMDVIIKVHGLDVLPKNGRTDNAYATLPTTAATLCSLRQGFGHTLLRNAIQSKIMLCMGDYEFEPVLNMPRLIQDEATVTCELVFRIDDLPPSGTTPVHFYWSPYGPEVFHVHGRDSALEHGKIVTRVNNPL
jgi:hypothetical protein